MDERIDLRSDTVTRPDAAMRRAMAEAEVGDDVYGEDPTVAALEAEAAAVLGFPAALFVPSGIMGNQIGVRLICPRGSELLLDARAHIQLFEMGAAAALSGVQTRPLPSDDGLPSVEAVRSAFSPRGGYQVATGALALENSHNVGGGRVYARKRIEPLLALAAELGLPVHLDGARLWNAAVALGTTPGELARGFDTVMCCLSKGLGAPVGSILVASEARIAEARAIRRQLGGAMRQAGVLAAAGLVALRDGPALLAADHRRARRLAEAIAALPGVELDPTEVQTNIGIFRVHRSEKPAPAAGFVAAARRRGVLLSAMGTDRVRFVTHRDLTDDDIETAIVRLKEEFA